MIGINELIYKVLTANVALSELISSTKVYVLEVPEKDENGDDNTNPVMQLARIVYPQPNKTSTENLATILINIYTDTYSEGISISKAVYKCLQDMKGRDDELEISIRSIKLESVQENKIDESFVQTMTFQIK